MTICISEYMSTLDNPKNVKGMAQLLLDDNELKNASDEIAEIENMIVTGGKSTKTKHAEDDFMQIYEKKIQAVGRNFESSLPKPGIFKMPNSSDMLTSDFKSKPSNPYGLEEEDDDEPVISTSWNAKSDFETKDPQLVEITQEHQKQQHVNQVIDTMDAGDKEGDKFLDEEDEEDELARITEQVDLLRNNLEHEGIDLSRIPDIKPTTSKKEAKQILKILQIKNDRLRYCDFFEEAVLAFAYGAEGVFNGQREIFGSKIDLTGYSDTVKVKLRRMRYDTSNFVSSVMQGYNISSGWRIILELVPSLFLYSRERRLKANDNLISDDAYKKAMQDLG